MFRVSFLQAANKAISGRKDNFKQAYIYDFESEYIHQFVLLGILQISDQTCVPERTGRSRGTSPSSPRRRKSHDRP